MDMFAVLIYENNTNNCKMPESAFRLGFTNGLMSESMVIWFIIILIIELKTG